MRQFVLLLSVMSVFATLAAQPWTADNSVFNPSGVPSLSFSQPRFADLDADGDQDFLLGNINRSPIHIKNNGTPSSPAYTVGGDITAGISSLAAEMAVCADMDADGDLDLVTGGYTGLHLFLKTASPEYPFYEEAANYFAGLTVGSNPVPDVADVDNDGDLDLVVGLSEDGAVRLYLNSGSPSAGQFSATGMQTIGDVGLYAYPVFCDLDADGDQDILCGRDLHGFIYYQNNGSPESPLWQENPTLFAGLGNSDYWNSPDLADLTGDGLFDLVFGTASGPLQYYVNAGTSSAPVWQANTTLFGGVMDVGGASSPVFFDFDLDGDLDLISGTQMGYIKYYENTGSPYAPAWQEDSAYFSSIDHSIYASAAAGDLDGDGLPDLVVGDLNGGLYFHRNTGMGLTEQAGVLPAVSLGGWSVPRLLDADADGDLDLYTGCEAGTMRFYQNVGTPQAPAWNEVGNYFGTIDVGSNSVPALADLDGDGDLDLLAGNLSGSLQCYIRGSFGWTLNTTLFAGIETDQNATPALADLDHDGDLDLSLGDYNGTLAFYRNQLYSGATLNPPSNIVNHGGQIPYFTWDPPQAGSTSPFEHYRVYLNGVLLGIPANPEWTFTDLTPGMEYIVAVTAQYVAGESLPATLVFTATSVGEEVPVPVRTEVRPNPFRGSASVVFELKQPETVRLSVFNAKGQLMRRLLDAPLPSGPHSIVWNGADSGGKPVAAGLYFYRLEIGSQRYQGRMILLK